MGLSLADVSKKYLNFGENCFKSSGPITMFISVGGQWTRFLSLIVLHIIEL